ncbi:MAG: AbrB/MazE/SpoVT family DNA-binding domain-containing protein [Candidatus Riflebacteria bacterium]|nr:AbrB/MazE/SpoVT family DNA-binding domain-containing protein [Candidatus Riflebacteria bacterium]
MKTKVQMWGNSLALRIPKPFALEINLFENAEVNVSLRNGRIIIEPISKEYSLDELVKKITPENRHGETDWGGPRGGEEW